MKIVKCFTLGLMLLAMTVVSAKTTQQTPQDPGVVNRERIAYWLQKNNQLRADASAEATQRAVDQFIGKLNTAPAKISGELSQAKRRLSAKIQAAPARNKSANKTVKVLAVLIDFPDLPYNNNRLTSSDTGMYYADYNRQHYYDMMFATSGYAGPSGQNLKTVYQYYQGESGGSFFFTGNVFDWVTADHNAAYYGAHDGDNKDAKAEDLVKEAVEKAVAANSINLADYDVEDPYDLDADGNIAEADGKIDHVIVFHSSIGEDSGGGVLGDDAIWAHRFFVDATAGGYTIGSTGKKLYGYTIQAIDSAIGVVSHEFGHDLGLPDEYDTAYSKMGEPVGMWSIMSGGSWAGISIAGAEPTSFSAYARDFLQDNHGGNWINQLTHSVDSLKTAAQTINLIDTNTHTGVNQIQVDLPGPQLEFKPPYAGSFQYYSGMGHDKHNALQFSVTVPSSANPKLTMKAHWDIESDNATGSNAWDYIRVYANNTALSGNQTVDSSSHLLGLDKFISGKSLGRVGAEGTLGWLDTEFSLSAFAGQTVTIKIEYVTDPAVNGYGFVADNIRVVSDAGEAYSDNVETADKATLNGFERVGNTRTGLAQNYWLQLRSPHANDNAMTAEQLDAGVLLWFNNPNYTDNNVGDHPGYAFIGVVDADQTLMKSGLTTLDSGRQVRDAAFSRYTQMSGRSGDTHLDANPEFNDANDYSSPTAPEAGLVLPKLGVRFSVSEQASDSTTAKIVLTATALALDANFTSVANSRSVTFSNTSVGGVGALTYTWDFGDESAVSHEMSPVHTYAADGSYTVTLTVTDSEATSSVKSQTVNVAASPVVALFNVTKSERTVTFTNGSNGGVGTLTYSWNFGDGSAVSSSASPSHTYSADGSYTVTLTVTDSEGSSDVFSQTIAVAATPEDDDDEGGGGGGNVALLTSLLLALLSAARRRQ